MKNICPVCKCENLLEPPYNKYGSGSDEICPQCGFQFGLDDFPDKEKGIAQWRENWIQNGRKWWSAARHPD